LVLYYIFKNISLDKKIDLAYFACQCKKGRMLIKVLSPSLEIEQVATYIQEEIVKYFNNDLTVELQFVEKLEMLDRKSQSFVSYLNDDRRTCN